MSRSGCKRHYRVAKKNIEEKQSTAFCVPKQKKNFCIVIVILLILLAFVKGMLAGIFLTKKD